jgi:hypothetical protein
VAKKKLKHDDGKHIDVKMMRAGRGGTELDFDYKNRTGQSFRERDETGAFKLTEHGKEKIKGRK